jgi:hypothetical protein
LPLVCAWVAWRDGLRKVLRVRWSLQLLRAGVGIAMLELIAYGLKYCRWSKPTRSSSSRRT